MAYEITNPDSKLSPFTGMNRRHWLDCGASLLDGVFAHVKNFEDPIVLPRTSDKIYPFPNDPPYKHRSAEFEGLARTFMIGSLLVADNPGLTVHGHNLRDYYA